MGLLTLGTFSDMCLLTLGSFLDIDLLTKMACLSVIYNHSVFICFTYLLDTIYSNTIIFLHKGNRHYSLGLLALHTFGNAYTVGRGHQ